MAFQLQITPSVGKRWTYTLDKALVRIGRANHCEVVINDQLVSREHCQLQLMSEGLFLEDLKSVNGTLLNGQRITRVLLHPGDRIRVGVSDILVEQIRDKERDKETAPPTQATKPKEPRPGPPKNPKSKYPKTEKPDRVREPEPVQPEKPKIEQPEEIKQSGKPEVAVSQEAKVELIPLVSKNQEPPILLVIHPDCSQIEPLLAPLAASGVVIHRASDSLQIKSILKKSPPDCILLCSQTEASLNVCQEIKSHSQAGPIVLLIHEESWENTLFPAPGRGG